MTNCDFLLRWGREGGKGDVLCEEGKALLSALPPRWQEEGEISLSRSQIFVFSPLQSRSHIITPLSKPPPLFQTAVTELP